MVNKVTLLGRLGADPAIETVKINGTDIQICKFNIATSETWKDKNGDKKENTQWHKCVAFRKLAEICAKYLKKGSLIYVEGKLSTDKYQDKAHPDITHYSTKVLINEMRMVSTGHKSDGGADTINQENIDAAIGGRDNDDLPF